MACMPQSDYAQKLLLTQILERHLDAVVIELLIVATELIAAIGRAIEELDHLAHRGVRRPLERGVAADIDGAIELKVVDVVIELTNQQSWHRLVANPQH